jgi:hypothetical protein
MKPDLNLEFDRELKLKTDTRKVPGRLQPQWPSIRTFGNKHMEAACNTKHTGAFKSQLLQRLKLTCESESEIRI